MIGALVAGQVGSGGASLSSYESIATATGTGSSGTISFTSIPSTFKHLQIRGIFNDSTGNNLQMQFNSDTGSNYARHRLRGDGASATASGNATQTFIDTDATIGYAASTMGAAIIDILDYASTTKNKTVRILSGYSTDRIAIGSGLWVSTSAITSIQLKSANNFTTSTTFALYGIKEA